MPSLLLALSNLHLLSKCTQSSYKKVDVGGGRESRDICSLVGWDEERAEMGFLGSPVLAHGSSIIYHLLLVRKQGP